MSSLAYCSSQERAPYILGILTVTLLLPVILHNTNSVKLDKRNIDYSQLSFRPDSVPNLTHYHHHDGNPLREFLYPNLILVLIHGSTLTIFT